jgi:hypothetical protein
MRSSRGPVACRESQAIEDLVEKMGMPEFGRE